MIKSSTAWLTPSTSLTTAGSARFADLFKPGDDITVLQGPAHKIDVKVKNVEHLDYSGPMLRIKTLNSTLEVPLRQIIFTDLNPMASPFIIVLAQFENSNWAILNINNFKELSNLGCRLAYILFSGDSKNTSLEKMIFSGINFGIPYLDITSGPSGRSLSKNSLESTYSRLPGWLSNIFKNIDTNHRAGLLLKAKTLDADFPHFSNFQALNVKPLNIIMFAQEPEKNENKSSWNHRIQLIQKNDFKDSKNNLTRSAIYDAASPEMLKLPGNDPQAWEMWNIDITKESYSELLVFARTLRALDSLKIIEKAVLTTALKPYVRFPACNLNNMMSLPMDQAGQNPKSGKISMVETFEYKGPLVRIVPGSGHTLIASNIIIPV